jgi:plasmid stabilization system protein ParE
MASEYLRREIAGLKGRFPSSVKDIDVALREYLNEEGPPADDEFIHGLEAQLESAAPKPYTGKGLPPKRPNRRTNYRA